MLNLASFNDWPAVRPHIIAIIQYACTQVPQDLIPEEFRCDRHNVATERSLWEVYASAVWLQMHNVSIRYNHKESSEDYARIVERLSGQSIQEGAFIAAAVGLGMRWQMSTFRGDPYIRHIYLRLPRNPIGSPLSAIFIPGQEYPIGLQTVFRKGLLMR